MTSDFVRDIKDKIGTENKLVISRVPTKALARFYELANSDEFVGDYGFVLKYLLDFHDGIIMSGIEPILVEIEQLKERLAGIESAMREKAQEPEYITMADGRKIEKKS